MKLASVRSKRGKDESSATDDRDGGRDSGGRDCFPQERAAQAGPAAARSYNDHGEGYGRHQLPRQTGL